MSKYIASKYNIFFTYEETLVGYNSYSNHFFILDALLYDLYNVASKQNNFEELNEVHPEFYSFLLSYGFIVDECINEFEIVKQHSIKIDNDDSLFHLIINPTMNCNFKCWYCYETHIKDSKMDEKTIRSVVTFAKNIIQNQNGLKKFILTFFGGEPLLYFHKVIKPILKELYTICKYSEVEFGSGMTTNGLLIDQEMLDYCKSYGLTSFQITLDGKKEKHDTIRFISEGKGSYDKIVSNIKLITKNKLFANVRINCSADTLDGFSDIINDFETLSKEDRLYVNFDLQKVWQEEENIDNDLRESKFMFWDKGYNIQQGQSKEILNSCYGDKRYQATINYNGEVFKCTARDFKNDSGEGVLTEDGTIIWNERYEKRLNSKFKNKPCMECRILPICGGGCTQQALEHEGVDYCVMNFDEDAKIQVVRNKFRELIA